MSYWATAARWDIEMPQRELPPFPTRASFETPKHSLIDLHSAPWWPPQQHIVEAATEAIKHNIYAPSQGLDELREAIAYKLCRENGMGVSSSEILITNGAMNALFIAFGVLLKPGDEVIVPVPSFFFQPQIEFFHGVFRNVECFEEAEFHPNLEGIQKAITPRTKAIIICTPSNPTGIVYTNKELNEITRIAAENNLTIISDESYEKMVYDGRRHVSIASIPDAKERTVTIHSFTKSYAMPGWRIGFIAANERFIEHSKRLLQWSTICCSYVAQRAALAALTGPQDWVKSVVPRYQHCRDLYLQGLAKIHGVSVHTPEGGPFTFPNTSKTGVEAERISQNLLTDYGVISVPGSSFFSKNHLRLPFGGEDEQIVEATTRIQAFFESLER
jgi:aspartate/methionine/tyrosine aminotransferase